MKFSAMTISFMIILIAMLLRKVGMDQPIPFHKPNKKKVSEKMMDHPSLNHTPP